MPNTSFSSGFASGGGVINAREDRRVLEEQNRLDQQNLLKEQAAQSAVAALEELKTASTKGSAAYFTSKGNNDQKGMDTAIAVQTRAAQELWGSTQQVLKATGHTEAEIANIGAQFRIAASLNNPAAEQKLIAAGEAEGKLASQQALEGQKQDAVQKQFLNSLDETVTQTKDGQFIDTQGNVITDVSKLNNLRNIPTTQNINQTNLTPKVTSALQTGILSDDDRIQRLNKIRAQINESPEFLQLPGKIKAKLIDKLDQAGIPVTEGGEKFLIAQTKFVRDSIENINSYIKEITGAQMSEKEADRLKLAQPDPGQDVFSGDGPIKFKAKADGAIEAASIAQARKIYFLEKGITHSFEEEAAKPIDQQKEPPISISGMKQIINEKGKEEARVIRAQNPDMPIADVMKQAQENVQKRFGMSQ